MRIRNERGASAVEYALLVAGIAAALIFTVHILGAGVAHVFNETQSTLSTTP